MIDAIKSVLTFLANVCFDVLGFFANLFAEKNYIALAAILAGFILLGTVIGIITAKIKHARRF